MTTDPNYRFSGYKFRLLTLDETGPSYILDSPNNFVVELSPYSDTSMAMSYGAPMVGPGSGIDVATGCPNLLEV